MHETLYDTEIGYKQNTENLTFGANLYFMEYKNQLVLTGKINDVGAYTRSNINNSFRRGIEFEGGIKISKVLYWSGNMTLSQNKIISFTEYIDNWDTTIQEVVEHENSDLLFSPGIIWVSQLNYTIKNKYSVDFTSKYIGKQFIDNTSSEDRMLNDYLINHLRFTYSWKNKIFNTTKLTLQINNLLNNEYVSNAWVYRFISEGWDPREGGDPYINQDIDGYNMIGYFPQATRNYMLGVTLRF